LYDFLVNYFRVELKQQLK